MKPINPQSRSAPVSAGLVMQLPCALSYRRAFPLRCGGFTDSINPSWKMRL
jgi:hypothetical protein